MKVKGKDRYLYRSIDSNGETLDMWLRNHRDTVSAKAFMKRLIRDYGQPRSIVTDKYAPSLKSNKELKEDEILVKNVAHWKSKYLNNILEQDHRQVKGKFPYGNSFQPLTQRLRPSKELKSFQLYTKKVEEKLPSSTFRLGMKLNSY